jgi:hypothetical protein
MNYYRVQLQNEPSPRFEWADSALEAIEQIKDELYDNGFLFLGNATARPAVYKEWNYDARRYTNGGDFIQGDLA